MGIGLAVQRANRLEGHEKRRVIDRKFRVLHADAGGDETQRQVGINRAFQGFDVKEFPFYTNSPADREAT